jgi:hypothetical protein
VERVKGIVKTYRMDGVCLLSEDAPPVVYNDIEGLCYWVIICDDSCKRTWSWCIIRTPCSPLINPNRKVPNLVTMANVSSSPDNSNQLVTTIQRRLQNSNNISASRICSPRLELTQAIFDLVLCVVDIHLHKPRWGGRRWA